MPPGERLALFRRQLESLLNSDECKLLTGVFSKDSARTRFIERLLTRFKVEECRAYLSEAAKLYREICEDESFAWLQHRRADILVAIERYGKTTKEFLSAMLVQEGRIAVMAEACGERLTPKQLRVLCLRTPRKAAAFEDALRQRCPRSGTESIGDPPQ
jgi:hypothetical protein